ncbi:hypothetical protein DVH24_035066 [Malus domestica]|uniref:Uncharacterized protein n=1 Tax=Malus domestica TaxID=3750 RepID=A0A498IHM5_MALDO|nr:hypothetical protein DVH24_035066 [Malus domestica]
MDTFLEPKLSRNAEGESSECAMQWALLSPPPFSFFSLLSVSLFRPSHLPPNSKADRGLGFRYASLGFISVAVLLEGNVKLFAGVDIENPVREVIPAPLSEHSAVPGSKDVIFCQRARVSGISRLKLGSYASSLKITLSTSQGILERLLSKSQVCFHRNNALGLCQCEEDDWKNIQKGLWSSVMSPYDERYVDVKFIGKKPGSVTITVEEDFQRWRLLCLALGFTLLLLAPIVSNWVPFYYSSSMVIGVFLVIIIILFQGMKLLPTEGKNVLYLTICGSALGAGSFLVHQYSLMVNSILLSFGPFGLSEEMHNPLMGTILPGAAFGYWIVRKFVVSKDGTVDSTLDTPLAIGALVSSWIISKLITSLKWRLKSRMLGVGVLGCRRGNRSRVDKVVYNFLAGLATLVHEIFFNVTGVMSPSSRGPNQQKYYSTFHKVQNRKKFTKKEWDDFTHESTHQQWRIHSGVVGVARPLGNHGNNLEAPICDLLELGSSGSDSHANCSTKSLNEDSAGRGRYHFGIFLFGIVVI